MASEPTDRAERMREAMETVIHYLVNSGSEHSEQLHRDLAARLNRGLYGDKSRHPFHPDDWRVSVVAAPVEDAK